MLAQIKRGRPQKRYKLENTKTVKLVTIEEEALKFLENHGNGRCSEGIRLVVLRYRDALNQALNALEEKTDKQRVIDILKGYQKKFSE